MKNPIRRYYEFLDRPIFPVGRGLLALLIIPLVLAFTVPLWRITLNAPQYPEGLTLDITTQGFRAGNNGQHLTEINMLNHYIGMHEISEQAIPDLGWMPFAIGLLMLLTLRVAAIGHVRDLIDLSVISIYTLGFFGARFVYKLYVYGHDLNPEAPVTVQPFTPAIIGSKQIANFTTHSWPQLGTLYMSLFVGGLLAITAWHLIAGRRAAKRRDAAARAASEAPAT